MNNNNNKSSSNLNNLCEGGTGSEYESDCPRFGIQAQPAFMDPYIEPRTDNSRSMGNLHPNITLRTKNAQKVQNNQAQNEDLTQNQEIVRNNGNGLDDESKINEELNLLMGDIGSFTPNKTKKKSLNYIALEKLNQFEMNNKNENKYHADSHDIDNKMNIYKGKVTTQPPTKAASQPPTATPTTTPPTTAQPHQNNTQQPNQQTFGMHPGNLVKFGHKKEKYPMKSDDNNKSEDKSENVIKSDKKMSAISYEYANNSGELILYILETGLCVPAKVLSTDGNRKLLLFRCGDKEWKAMDRMYQYNGRMIDKYCSDMRVNKMNSSGKSVQKEQKIESVLYLEKTGKYVPAHKMDGGQYKSYLVFANGKKEWKWNDNVRQMDVTMIGRSDPSHKHRQELDDQSVDSQFENEMDNQRNKMLYSMGNTVSQQSVTLKDTLANEIVSDEKMSGGTGDGLQIIKEKETKSVSNTKQNEFEYMNVTSRAMKLTELSAVPEQDEMVGNDMDFSTSLIALNRSKGTKVSTLLSLNKKTSKSEQKSEEANKQLPPIYTDKRSVKEQIFEYLGRDIRGNDRNENEEFDTDAMDDPSWDDSDGQYRFPKYRNK